MRQLSLFEEEETEGLDKSAYVVEQFSADGAYIETARQELEEKYKPILEVTTKFDRQSVSYQLSKKICCTVG